MNSTTKLHFVQYYKDDLEQKMFLNELENDEEIPKYINDIVHDVKYPTYTGGYSASGYLVKDSDIEKYIGVAVIKTLRYDKTSITVEQAIHQNYRHSDKKYGTKILNDITNLLFTEKNISKIILEIKMDNIPAIKSAINCGFAVDELLQEIFENEGYEYIPYAKRNPNYKYIASTTSSKAI